MQHLAGGYKRCAPLAAHGPRLLQLPDRPPAAPSCPPERRGSPGATSASGGSSETAAVLTRSVGAYFHSDGHLCEEAVRRDTQQLLQRFVEAKTK